MQAREMAQIDLLAAMKLRASKRGRRIWSHENCPATFSNYGEIPAARQAEIIRDLAAPECTQSTPVSPDQILLDCNLFPRPQPLFDRPVYLDRRDLGKPALRQMDLVSSDRSSFLEVHVEQPAAARRKPRCL
jgi:hypothetical protein